MSHDTRLEKRRFKFSEHARQQILNHQLHDQFLLSRSGAINKNLHLLQNDQAARMRLWTEIEAQESLDGNSPLIEHGLRKLREIIITVDSESYCDVEFRTLAARVCEKTVQFYSRRGEHHKSYPFLKFYVHNLLIYDASEALSQELAICCALYISHYAHDISLCLSLLRSQMSDFTLHELCKTLSLVYCIKNEPSCVWFRAMTQIPASSLVRQFLETLPAFEEMKQRTIQMVSSSYNQISISFLSAYWFSGLWADLEPQISQKWSIETLKTGTRVVKFKSKRS
ncbi:LAME_0F01156g1_1 [Lachancea meyersii CBS 8951]|uniref:LAME_0F01156g1_1 n=1 Tax=Lachancea meyersii CBS 8951 TaxID=1266667 RepID=A0A1G4JPP1_9SACH|nr:LAME_0F01156g1_1 [Lachancea meyersii CBS 8951]